MEGAYIRLGGSGTSTCACLPLQPGTLSRSVGRRNRLRITTQLCEPFRSGLYIFVGGTTAESTHSFCLHQTFVTVNFSVVRCFSTLPANCATPASCASALYVPSFLYSPHRYRGSSDMSSQGFTARYRKKPLRFPCKFSLGTSRDPPPGPS